MLRNTNSYIEFKQLANQLIELVCIEERKIIQLHSDFFLKSSLNFRLSHFYLIDEFTLNSFDRVTRKTLLHKAVDNGNFDLVNLLVGHYGALVNTSDIYGDTPLFSSIKLNQQRIFKFLIHYGAILNYNQLRSLNFRNFECSSDMFNLVLSQLGNFVNQSRVPPPSPLPVVQLISNGALHLALIKHSSFSFIKFLLMNGADPNEMNAYGLTPCHLAVAWGLRHKHKNSLIHYQNDSQANVRILKLLFEFNANLSTSSSGMIPLNLALTWSNSFSCVEFLFSKTDHYCLNLIDKWNYTSLDRIWYRMNNFRYFNDFSDSKRIFHEKVQCDLLIRSFQALLKRFICAGALANKYQWNPQKFTYNYYLSANLTVLLRYLLIWQHEKLNQKFLVEKCTFLIEKLACKFTALFKRHLSFKLQESDFNFQLKLFESELGDFKWELERFKSVIEILLTGGYTRTNHNRSVWGFNKKLIKKIFKPFLSTNQIDFKTKEKNMELMQDFYKNLQTLSISPSETTPSIEYRKQLLAMVYENSQEKLKNPLTLQEICRIEIRNSVKDLENLNLSKNLKRFLFYEDFFTCD